MAADMSLPWPANIPELKRLDELLRCGICYDFMSTSMVTACSHNYCSLCIRQYLDYKTQCPACFSETTSQQLRNNRLLDEIIGLFPNLRDKVAKLCQSSKGNSITSYLGSKDLEHQDPADDLVNGINTPSRYQEDSSASPKAKSVKDFMPSPRIGKTLLETPKRNLGKTLSSSSNSPLLRGSQAEPSTSGSSSTASNPKASSGSPASIFSSQSSSPASSQNSRQTASGQFSIRSDFSTVSGAQDETRVSCPVCCVEVPERNINLHLDACLKRMEKGSEEEIMVVYSPKRKPLPKLVYSLLSEKQLRQKLKDIGLSVQGDKPLLVSRHRRYTTLYNAECDVAEPRPVSQLLRQIEREERDEAKVASSRSIFTYDRKTAPEIIEKEQNDYVKKNEDHFSKLIAEVKKRREEAKKAKESKKEQLDPVTTKPVKEKRTLNAEENRLPKNVCEDVEHKSKNNLNNREEHSCKSKKLFSLFNSNALPDGVTTNNIALNKEEKPRENFVNDSTMSDGENLENNNDEIKSATGSSVPLPVTSSSVDDQRKEFPALKNIAEESCESGVAEPSPDFFSGSPADSQSSCGSFSLLQDCDPLCIQNPELPDGENEDEDIIPGHQPESCSDDDQDCGKTPSPQLGRRSTRSNKISNALPVPELQDLGPETQSLMEDSQGDPDYLPSQLLDAVDPEDMDFQPIQSQTRRSTRKRKVTQDAPTKATRRRKR
ncbi:E3 ubiquitin-protein ligase RAD18-like isoform X2 [Penaeus japonicus]|uniref:E3 ubiquitin-protein ligase RAD18-like isoform X2 n=1 Tax=Penaeus japonicus TaxID=27405 RepID=UPI001C712A77|nr:E3 ubiquitin-protein ligase RAD18-like isoform X2 [Penaeus japonicus]